MTYVVTAELVGSVLLVQAEAGQAIKAGDTVVILESMKMEIPVLTEVDGVVREVGVNAGDVVQEGDVLAVIEEQP